MKPPRVISAFEWRVVRRSQGVKEKESTHARDALGAREPVPGVVTDGVPRACISSREADARTRNDAPGPIAPLRIESSHRYTTGGDVLPPSIAGTYEGALASAPGESARNRDLASRRGLAASVGSWKPPSRARAQGLACEILRLPSCSPCLPAWCCCWWPAVARAVGTRAAWARAARTFRCLKEADAEPSSFPDVWVTVFSPRPIAVCSRPASGRPRCVPGEGRSRI